MKLHFANSAFVSARERFVQRGGRRTKIRLPVRYGILEHPEAGLTLIDTGYGPRVTMGRGRSFGLRLYSAALPPELLPEGAIETALARLGYAPSDLQQIIVTHFHADHVAALLDLPNVQVITDLAALRSISRRGYLKNVVCNGVFTELLPRDLAERVVDIASIAQAPLGLGPGRDLFGDGSVLAIPLPGHAEGHFGLCFPAFDPPLLYGCDAQWVLAALDPDVAPGFPASLLAVDRQAAARSTAQLARFRDEGGQVILCHDPAPTAYDLKAPDR